nr:hypothetical protein [Tanacetum cinerariifolium]
MLDKLIEVAESSHLQDKIKVMFDQLSWSSEAFGARGEIVAGDSMLLDDLEKPLARAQVKVVPKDGYVTDMEEKE